MMNYDDENCPVKKRFSKILNKIKEKIAKADEARFWTYLYTATFAAVVIIMVGAQFIVWYLLQFRK